MKKISAFVAKKLVIGIFLFLLSLLPWRDILLPIRLTNKDLDLVFVIFSMLFPHMLRTVAIALIVSSLFFIFKSFVLPKGKIEKELYRIRKRRIVKNVFYSLFLVLPLIFPFRSGAVMGIFINNIPFPGYWSYLKLLFLPFMFMDSALFLISLPAAFFLVHIVRILSIRLGTFEFEIPQKVFEEGRPFDINAFASSPLPLFSLPLMTYKMKSKIESGFFKNWYSLNLKGNFKAGYYCFDIVKFKVSSFPFFFSTIYKVANTPSDIIVLPKVKVKNTLYSKNPFFMRETGDLVKKVSGGSLEFAGIKEFSPGDPVSKIWWKGLAKSGRLMKKDFFSLAEDRWLLVIDLSDPNIKKEDEAAVFTFSRAFVEMFTRKDIEVGIHIISPGASFLTYSTKKKDLLSFIVKHWSEFRHISHEGSREIIKDIVGDSSQIEDRCKVNGISLSSFLFYSGLFTKQKKTFYWSKERVFRDNMTELLKNLRKSGKILVVTPKMNEDFVDQVRKLSRIKKCSLLFASFEKVPKAQTFIISRNNPEKTVWRLVYA